MKNLQSRSLLITVDVEDWFQVENFKPYIPFSSWDLQELRIYESTVRLLDLFDSMEAGHTGTPEKIRATFFILGWVAAKLPQLVREIERRGHEVASHGFYHRLTPECSDKELIEDLTDSRKLLEDITGKRVYGYRAPSFSVNNRLLIAVKDCGYLYDSSYNSFGGNGRYGRLDLTDRKKRNSSVFELGDGFYELPITNYKAFGKTVPWGGGGYFRMIPSALYINRVRSILRENGAFVFYLHPWEVDPGQPRVSEAAPLLKFRHYLNLDQTAGKLEKLIRGVQDACFSGCKEYLDTLI